MISTVLAAKDLVGFKNSSCLEKNLAKFGVSYHFQRNKNPVELVLPNPKAKPNNSNFTCSIRACGL